MSGRSEAFTESLAQFLLHDLPEAELKSLRSAYPEAAARGDGYLACAARYGPKIADHVEKRVKAERWLKP